MPDTSESELFDSSENKKKIVIKGERESKHKSKPKSPRQEQKYRKAWGKQFPWIKPSKDHHKAVCSKCNFETSVQITPLKLHQKSKIHRNCVLLLHQKQLWRHSQV